MSRNDGGGRRKDQYRSGSHATPLNVRSSSATTGLLEHRAESEESFGTRNSSDLHYGAIDDDRSKCYFLCSSPHPIIILNRHFSHISSKKDKEYYSEGWSSKA